jgi:2-keto-3-deoxy-L-fuconate dehydrogenase
MADRLLDKRIVVTGAAQGIGRAAVERCCEEGARVIAVDRQQAGLQTLAAATGCDVVVLDVADRVATERFASALSAVDGLLCGAGVVAVGNILESTEEEWATSFDVNVTSIYRLVRGILPGMVARRRGSIVTVASVAGCITAVADRSVYSATKAAVVGLTKSVAKDFIGCGIRANAICPGTIESPSLIERMRATADYDATRAQFIARQPMGRFGCAREVADLAVYLLADESAFTTGQVHVIDGGWTM